MGLKIPGEKNKPSKRCNTIPQKIGVLLFIYIYIYIYIYKCKWEKFARQRAQCYYSKAGIKTRIWNYEH